MVTRDAVLTIFEECDRDNDGIVWLSEIKQLALSYASNNEVCLRSISKSLEILILKWSQRRFLTLLPGCSLIYCKINPLHIGNKNVKSKLY